MSVPAGERHSRWNLSRNFTLKIHFILDQLLPPVLRDCYAFMALPMRMFFSKKYKKIMEFKKNLPYMSAAELEAFYKETAPYHMPRETDLNHECVEAILRDLRGDSVLDVGCGRGYLAGQVRVAMSSAEIFAMDFNITEDLPAKYPNINFISAPADKIPFDDASIDTVLCTHVLKHVVDFKKVVSEIRRVARKRVIIVVPSQRSYKYTFDLHVRFFPYVHSFLLEMMPFDPRRVSCAKLSGDIYYVEDRA